MTSWKEQSHLQTRNKRRINQQCAWSEFNINFIVCVTAVCTEQWTISPNILEIIPSKNLCAYLSALNKVSNNLFHNLRNIVKDSPLHPAPNPCKYVRDLFMQDELHEKHTTHQCFVVGHKV